MRWPSGQIDVHTGLPAGRQLRLFEGEAGYHVVEPTSWEHTLPDTIEVGATLAWEARVQPALFASDARIAGVTADLSSWGGSAAEPLVPVDDGTYRLPSGSGVVEGLPGQREMTVLIEQTAASGSVWTLLVHPIHVVPIDRPTGPQPVYVDDLAPGWQIDTHIEHWDTTTPEIEVIQDGRVAVAPRSRIPAFRGQAALAVHVDSLTPVTGSSLELWRLSFSPPEPIEHYRTLRFAFHPGTARPVILPPLHLFVNDRHVTMVLLSTEPVWAAWSRMILDIGVRQWHVVELPLDFPGLEGPIESISFAGVLAGTFYLDEIELLPDAVEEPWRVTAVQEVRESALPSAFSLQQNYPNPFNSGTVIRFELPEAGETELVVYNLAGQKAAALVQGMREAGSYTIRWDGRDDGGRSMASGVYFYRLRSGEKVETRKILLLR